MEYVELSIQYINATEKYTMHSQKERFESVEKAKEWIKENFGKHKRINEYIDTIEPDKPLHIGFVFSRWSQYEDTHKRFLENIWVTFHRVTREFVNLGEKTK